MTPYKSQVQLLDKDSVDRFAWPETESARHARDLLVPMIKQGVESFITNTKTELYLLVVDDHVIPITVNEKEYDSSYITSNYFAISYYREKLVKKHPKLAFLQTPFLKMGGWLLKGMKINKSIIINNWLLSSCIYPDLTEEQSRSITDFLAKKFPDHLLIYRGVNLFHSKRLAQVLKQQRYRMVGSREVYIYDPALKAALPKKARYHHRRDRRLVAKEEYEVIRNGDLTEEERERILDLYRRVYVEKHTQFSPQYTDAFLRNAIDNKILRLVGVKKEGKIEAVFAAHCKNGAMIVPFLGYETKSDEAIHLYRMLTMLIIDEAEERDLTLNDGSGGSVTKENRGMKPYKEYTAVYDRHLPLGRRLFWGIVEKLISLSQRLPS